MTRYIEIHLRESESTGWLGRPLYEEIVHFLWQSGAPGITVFRGEEGLDQRGNIQNIHSEYLSNALPMTLHLIEEDNHRLDTMMEQIRSRLQKHEFFIFMTDVINAKTSSSEQGVLRMEVGNTLKIYMKEEDRYQDSPLYHAIVTHLRKRDILWVNVQRALEGFGADHVVRRNKIFEFANHSPVLVEVTCTAPQMKQLVEELQPFLLQASGPAIILEGQFMKGSHRLE